MNITVNEAKNRRLLIKFDLLDKQTKGRIMICDDSNLVIRKMRGEIDFKAPGLQLIQKR